MNTLAHAAGLIAAGRPLRLACFGSSTIAGYGASDPARTGFTPRLAGLLAPRIPGGLTLFNHGASGETATGMAARLPDVLAERPDLVIWQTGSNDATAPDAADPAALARFRTLTEAGLDAFAAIGADIVLMDIQYSRNMLAAAAMPAYLAALAAIAAARDIPLYPRHALMRARVEQGEIAIDAMSPDGTHLTDAGYAWLARSVERWLAPYLGLDPGLGPDSGAPAVSA